MCAPLASSRCRHSRCMHNTSSSLPPPSPSRTFQPAAIALARRCRHCRRRVRSVGSGSPLTRHPRVDATGHCRHVCRVSSSCHRARRFTFGRCRRRCRPRAHSVGSGSPPSPSLRVRCSAGTCCRPLLTQPTRAPSAFTLPQSLAHRPCCCTKRRGLSCAVIHNATSTRRSSTAVPALLGLLSQRYANAAVAATPPRVLPAKAPCASPRPRCSARRHVQHAAAAPLSRV